MSIKESIASMRQPTDTSVDDELRESLRSYGWIAEFPAIDDEHGVRLIGNRRTRIAAELGIEPVVKVLTLGEGEAADAERLKLAFVSNIGGRPLSAEDKKRLAIHLYKQSWTQQRIADALGVGQPMVVKYLAGVGLSPGDKPPSRPKGGRPKSPPRPPREKKPKSEPGPDTVAARIFEAIASAPDGLTRDEVAVLLDIPDQTAGPRMRELYQAKKIFYRGKRKTRTGKLADVGYVVVEPAEADEEDRRAAPEEPIDPTTLSLTAQEKLANAIRQHKKVLDAEYNQRRSAEIDQHIREVVRPLMQKRLDEAELVIRARRGVMTRPVYKKIWACLHPDRLAALRAGDEKLEQRFAEAFHLFSELEVVLCDEKEMPTPRLVLTPEMMAARKAEVQAQRRAQRAAKKGNGSVSAHR